MADFDISHFDNHDKTDSHADDTDENIPLNPGGQLEEEDPLGNQTENKKDHSGGGTELKKEDSLILTWTVCTRSYLSIIAELRMQPIVIT